MLVILLVVYRSPILPFAVLLSAVFGLSAASLVVYQLALNDVITLSGQSQGILFILVVGASTDYALLLVSRFKEELHDEVNSWVALKHAWRGSVEPIVASAATVYWWYKSTADAGKIVPCVKSGEGVYDSILDSCEVVT